MPELSFQATPRQWALICVLGAVLVAVLVFNRPADTADSGVALAALPATTSAASKTQASNANQRSRLPEFTADEVAAVNPFARLQIAGISAQTAESPAEAVEDSMDAEEQRKLQREKALAELRSKRVRFVIGNENGATALVGDQRIRVGEIVSGFRVVRIDQTGVELVPAE
jgi:hypothetical protein